MWIEIPCPQSFDYYTCIRYTAKDMVELILLEVLIRHLNIMSIVLRIYLVFIFHKNNFRHQILLFHDQI